MARLSHRELLFAIVLSSAACGDDGAAPSPADAGPTADAEPPPPDAAPDAATRSLALASTGVQLDLDDGIGMFEADLATDVDVISIHQDFYGVPWDELEADLPPPPQWVAEMDRLRDHAQAAGKPVFLSLQLVGGAGRRHLADRVTITDGQLGKQESWSAECYDFRTAPDAEAKKQAWVQYVRWMIEKFDPTWLNLAIEMNLFMACTDAWPGLVDVEREAYLAAHEEKPDIVAFPSIQIDVLHGYDEEHCPPPMSREDCYDTAYSRLDRVLRDRFAISTYPHLVGEIAQVENIPPDWFTRAADRGVERLLVAETGWNATPAVGIYGMECVTAIEGAPDAQLAYFDRLHADADAAGADLVAWWSNRDLVPSPVMTDCPCNFDDTWCAIVEFFRSLGGSDPVAQFYAEMVLKVWGNMGLRTYDGSPREPLYSRWWEIRQATWVAE